MLGTEKGIDKGPIAELVCHGPKSDAALFFSTDGDCLSQGELDVMKPDVIEIPLSRLFSGSSASPFLPKNDQRF